MKLQDVTNREIVAMYSKNNVVERCAECGGKGHNKKNCWSVVGYPKWHSKYKRNVNNMSASKWKGNKNSGGSGQQMAHNAVVHDDGESDNNVMLLVK